MNRTSSSIFLLYLAVFGLAAFVGYRFLHLDRETVDPSAKPLPITPAGKLADDETTTIKIFEEASPSVVNVQSLISEQNPFNLNVQKIARGTGTGFVWDEKGHIVTNYHVVKDAGQVQVTLWDHSTWDAYQVKYDELNDLAVLWTNAPAGRLKPLPIGESSKLKVGQKTFAIGNPFGLDQTLTTGIVSALDREIEGDGGRTVKGMIQTDAAINPGNSGGPLLDSSGRLIGVNTAIISPSGTSAGIGFAIPVDEVNRVVPRLLRNEVIARPSLGIQAAPDTVAARLGIDGVVILNVYANGPAAKAGLKPSRRGPNGRINWGDAITALDDHKVDSTETLADVLEKNYQVGQSLKVHYLRDGEEKEATLTLTANTK
ncbi:MAG TPA: trypsin-like peptidase domain-containing protein [Gemmataceae bacterium]|jgi:S1-C subfamily serine protease|nr:trypsin-like peptidase domain-containing protein [Gemmataceae bacterium]